VRSYERRRWLRRPGRRRDWLPDLAVRARVRSIALVLSCTPLIARPILANRNLPTEAPAAPENAGGQSR
jgi:hypothetical protein